MQLVNRPGARHPPIHGHATGQGLLQARTIPGTAPAAPARRRGYAEEAARAFMPWASADQSITRFRASIGPGNRASLHLIRKLGLVQVGIQHHDRRGEELVFHGDDHTAPNADTQKRRGSLPAARGWPEVAPTAAAALAQRPEAGHNPNSGANRNAQPSPGSASLGGSGVCRLV